MSARGLHRTGTFTSCAPALCQGALALARWRRLRRWATLGSSQLSVGQWACQRPWASGVTARAWVRSPSATSSASCPAGTRPRSASPPFGAGFGSANCAGVALWAALPGAEGEIGFDHHTCPLRGGSNRSTSPRLSVLSAEGWPCSAKRGAQTGCTPVAAGRRSSHCGVSAVLNTTSSRRPSCSVRQASAPGPAALARSRVGVPRLKARSSRRNCARAASSRYSGACASKRSRPPLP